jgi:hypothetical protein
MKIKELSEVEMLAYEIKANGIGLPENVLIGVLLESDDFERSMENFSLYNIDFDRKIPTEFLLNTSAGIKFVIGKK